MGSGPGVSHRRRIGVGASRGELLRRRWRTRLVDEVRGPRVTCGAAPAWTLRGISPLRATDAPPERGEAPQGERCRKLGVEAGCGGTNARCTSRQAPPSERGELRSCPQVVEQIIREPRLRPKSSNIGRGFAECDPILASFGQQLPTNGQPWPTSTNIGQIFLKLAPNRPTSPNIKQSWPQIGRDLSMLANFWPACVQAWPSLGSLSAPCSRMQTAARSSSSTLHIP